MLEQSTTENTMVDLFFQLVRTLPETEVSTRVSAIMEACKRTEDKSTLADLFVLAFQTRDPRGGKGEKKLFYTFLLELFKDYPETVMSLMEHMPTYGYGKDLIAIFELCELNASVDSERLSHRVCRVFADQLRKDKAELEQATLWRAEADCNIKTGLMLTKPRLSMLGKYAPRAGTAHQTFRKSLTKALFGDSHDASRSYRKLVVELSAYLEVPEAFMCTDRYDEINFKKVPSLCLNRNRKAFLNEKLKTSDLRLPDDVKRNECREHLIANAMSGQVTGKALMPHELVTKVGSAASDESLVIDAQWSKIKEGVVEQIAKFATEALAPGAINLGKLCSLVDVSGSMSGEPMEVAIALGILVSELSDPAFKDRFITFHEQPSWVSLEGLKSLKDKVAKTRKASWGGSTNFNAAITMILDVAVQMSLTPEEIPDLIVFSDMQFDQADRGFNGTMHNLLVERFADAGTKICGRPYHVPKIIYWNLRSTGGYPVTASTPNTQLLSGFSPSLLKLLFSGQPLETEEEVEIEEDVVQEDGSVVKVKTAVKVKRGINPYETLRACLDDERYFLIREALSASEEGMLAAYSFERPPQEEAPDPTPKPSGGGGTDPDTKLKIEIVEKWTNRGLSIPSDFDAALPTGQFITRFFTEVSAENFAMADEVESYPWNTPESSQASLTMILGLLNDNGNF